MRRLLASLAVLGAAVAAPGVAHAYPSGEFPLRALAPIYSPDAGRPGAEPLQVLARTAPAAAWNTLNECLYQQGRPLLFSAGDGGAYRARDHAHAWQGSTFTQAFAYSRYLAGGPPAWPPGSPHARHGYGRAVDLGAPSAMRPLLDSRGPPLGWSWINPATGAGWVPSEDWHVEYHGHFTHRDPGTSPARPNLQVGSGGRCQALDVAKVQRRLQALGYFPHHVGGSFNQATRLAVYTYQVARRFKHPNGIVGRNTWLALRQRQAGRKTVAAKTTAVAKLSGLKHGARGQAVVELSRDLAYVRHHRNHRDPFYHHGQVSFFTAGLGVALRAWQADNHLSATGVYDAQSQRVMGTSLRYWHRKLGVATPVKRPPVPADHPTPAPKPAPSGSRLFADISGNNASVNLRRYVATGHHIIIIKLTEGPDFRSDSAVARWHLADQLHMTRAAYDFARPTRGPPQVEARYFAAYAHRLGWHRGDIAVLDWEAPEAEGGRWTGWVQGYTRELARQHIRLGLIYSYGSYIAGTLGPVVFHGPLGPIGYWHAQYTSTVSASTAPSWARSRLAAIQYTDGTSAGARGLPHSMPGIGPSDVSKLNVVASSFAGYGQR